MHDQKIIPAITIVGYNRKDSLERVLTSVVNAQYEYNNIKLIVSLDHSDKEDELVYMVNAFKNKWKHGSFELRTTKERLGLRKHILKCGDVAIECGAVIILEDDIIVSPYFYEYTVQSVNYYKNNESVAGIALYSHKWNGYVGEFFEPLNNGADCYFGQFSVTWGQCWTARQWLAFKEWYNENQKLVPNANIPAHVHRWPDTSWGKYFVHYIVEKNKYYLMPYVSLATNFADAGQHIKICSTEHQVPLLFGNKTYHFPDDRKIVKYDIFFENINLIDFLSRMVNSRNICVNLYGDKCMDGYDFALTKLRLQYHIVKSYSLVMQPQELNIFYNISGSDIFLYDLRKQEKNRHKNYFQYLYKLLDYNVKYISCRKSFVYGMFKFRESLGILFKRLRKKY